MNEFYFNWCNSFFRALGSCKAYNQLRYVTESQSGKLMAVACTYHSVIHIE